MAVFNIPEIAFDIGTPFYIKQDESGYYHAKFRCVRDKCWNKCLLYGVVFTAKEVVNLETFCKCDKPLLLAWLLDNNIPIQTDFLESKELRAFHE